MFITDDELQLSVWYNIIINTKSSKIQDVVDVKTVIRSPVAVNINVQNPHPIQPITFDVRIMGSFLSGPEVFSLQPSESKIYQLLYNPIIPSSMLISKVSSFTSQSFLSTHFNTPLLSKSPSEQSDEYERGYVIFSSYALGEFTWQLNLYADDIPPISLKNMKSELGLFDLQEVKLENHYTTTYKLECLSSNTVAFKIIPMSSLLKQALELMESSTRENSSALAGAMESVLNMYSAGQSNQTLITVRPFSKVEFVVMYTPTCIDTKETAELILFSKESGAFIYNVNGIGKRPTNNSCKYLTALVNESIASQFDVKNPFDFPVLCDITLQTLGEKKPDVLQILPDNDDIPFSLHLKSTSRILVPPRQTLGIPIDYFPRRLGSDKAKIFANIYCDSTVPSLPVNALFFTQANPLIFIQVNLFLFFNVIINLLFLFKAPVRNF
jgi:hypothetical protein